MRILLIIIVTLFSPYVLGQILNGKVFEKNVKGEINYLPGANVYWQETSAGTTTDINGHFAIALPPTLPAALIVSYVGYIADTILVNSTKSLEIELKSTIQLKEVSIEEKRQTTQFSVLTPINVETITNKELQKAACCNLSESFETNASVDVNVTDAVSGAKQIQMLGLDGSYSQILFENMPAIRGLTTSYGLGYVPGTWVESIQISKGAGSVVNGYESMTGQINVEFLKPEEAEKLFVNGYVSNIGRYEGNVHLANQFSEKWSTLLFAHGSTINKKNDMNNDSFLDVPMSKQLNIFNRWMYENGKNYMSQFGVRGLVEEKEGGQTAFDYGRDYGLTGNYGLGTKTRQVEVFSKNALSFNAPYKGLGLIANAKRYEQNSFYGLRKYKGEQNTLYFNLIYQTIISTTFHKVKTGASYMADHYSERLDDSLFYRKESVPGLFAEYNYDDSARFSIVAGIRSDYHNLYGMLVNPRIHFKYHIKPLTVVRLSAGRGLRVTNVFAENTGVLISSRKINVLEALRPEIAWNYGITFTHKFNLKEREVVLNADFYRTDFVNQVIADFDANPHGISFYNLKGRSYSNSFQAEAGYEAVKNFHVKAAYKWYDVKSTYNGILREKPFLPRHRVLFNAAYATKFDKWKFDFTAKWFGKSRIPEVSSHHGAASATQSKNYMLFNTQITRAFKHVDVYLGSENLSNFMQHNPVLAAGDPFGPDFDASMVWGPVMGRVIYAGFRYIIK